MRVSRISIPGAPSEASASALTFEKIEETILNPIDPGEIADLAMARAASEGNYSNMPGYEEYGRKSKNGQREASRLNLLKRIKGRQIENAFRSSEFAVFAKSD